MARSPEAEARYKAYQKKYHAERNARARYSYERLEKAHRVIVNGKDLSAELMQRRAPGITGETPLGQRPDRPPLQVAPPGHAQRPPQLREQRIR